jgi:hypothetical protein
MRRGTPVWIILLGAVIVAILGIAFIGPSTPTGRYVAKGIANEEKTFWEFQMGGSHWFTGADAIRDLELIANRTRNGFGPTITEPTSQAPFEFEPPGLDSISMINQDKRLRFGRGNSRHSFRTAVLLRRFVG